MTDPQITFLSVIFLLGTLQSIFFAAILFTRQTSNRLANIYLALLLLVFAADLANEFLDHSLYGLQYIRLMIILAPTDFLYGPLVWFYTSTMTSRSGRILPVQTMLHFFPALAHCLIIWPTLFQPLTESADFLNSHPELLQGNQIQIWITHPYIQPAAAIQMAIYFVLSLRRLQQHSATISNEFSYREGIDLRWLQWLLYSLIVVYVLFLFRFLIAEYANIVSVADIALNLGIVVIIYAMGFYGIHQLDIYARLRATQIRHTGRVQFPEPERPSVTDDRCHNTTDFHPVKQGDAMTTDKSISTNSETKYSRSGLSNEMSTNILKRLKSVMEEQKPYLNNNLALPDLADMVATNPNYLSQVINEQLQTSFFDYINSYRIETARQLLINPPSHVKTILDIAYESAFNSKSAFYNAFRKHVGMTPSEYKSSLH